MVDSRKGGRMADRIDDLAGRVEVVEQKVGQLSASVDQRFDQVDAALVEQRLYTEFAFERLDGVLECPAGSPVATMCPPLWPNLQMQLGISPDAGAPGLDAGAPTLDATTPALDAGRGSSASGCGCRVSGPTESAAAAGWLFALLSATGLVRRAPRRAPCSRCRARLHRRPAREVDTQRLRPTSGAGVLLVDGAVLHDE